MIHLLNMLPVVQDHILVTFGSLRFLKRWNFFFFFFAPHSIDVNVQLLQGEFKQVDRSRCLFIEAEFEALIFGLAVATAFAVSAKKGAKVVLEVIVEAVGFPSVPGNRIIWKIVSELECS
jgi:hypothetical protein